VIDNDHFRKDHGIRKLLGTLYSSGGRVIQEFESSCDETGKLQTSCARHEDGTETRFPKVMMLPNPIRSALSDTSSGV
jgi:hypothetical protein